MATARALPLSAMRPVESDVVGLAVAVETDRGVLPRGAEGTVVMVWDEGGYGVEFEEPLQGVFNLRPEQLILLHRI
jgi:hypothetical protein